MPLLFSRLCDLFSDLEQLIKHDAPLLPKTLQQRIYARISQWFGSLNLSNPATDIDRAALLSAIFPKKRKDRVYYLKAEGLAKKLKRVLCLGRGRWELLDQWKKSGRGDLGECVMRALQGAEHPLPCASRQVTVEEIDRVLAGIAKGVRFSAPTVRDDANVERLEVNQGLERIYRRLQSREAKWFTRMILQDYTPLDIPEWLVYRCIDSQLPITLKLHDHFEDAIKLLDSLDGSASANSLKPRVGVKVGRPSYRPARGIKDAVQTIRGRKMSVERKYDGEYCQVHVDLRKTVNSFQLFSKSGKDSTVDRAGLHETLAKCLRIDREDCGISTQCILEGEMVVWSDRENRILDFCKIRKHISRTGSFLGTDLDSQPHPWEHMMIVFYDVLLLDEHLLLPLPHSERRKLLEQLVLPIRGRADLVMQRELDFSHPGAPRALQEHFAHAIANRWEGLVLKPLNEPYFGPAQRAPNTYPSCWLKMKKDYITGLGDTADFSVIGAGYDVQEASRRGDKRLRWTHFHIGCLKNKAAVIHLKAKPEYVVLDAVTNSINPKDMTYLNQHGQFRAIDVGSPECSKLFGFYMTSGMAAKMTVAFKQPFVFEVMGGGFDKPPNSEYYRLRWPRVLKIHLDRDYKDAMTMDDLQIMATEALAVPLEEDLAEEIETWQNRLDAADRGSRKVMLPWDDSQYEKSDDEVERSGTRISPRRPTIASSKGRVAAPLVRMDTVEMRPGERRMPNGEVTCRPTSQGSVCSAASRSSLPTPPTSSPGGEGSVSCESSRVTPQTPTPRRKRKSDVIIIDDDSPPQPKRQRRHGDPHITPLQAAVNAPNRKRPSSPIQPASHESHKRLKTESFLVRKIPAMSDARFLPKSRRKPWEANIEPSSTARETTASESATQTTSVTSQAAATMSTQELSAQSSNLEATPAPTQDKNERARIEMPDFSETPVMLSPCIRNSPEIIETYIQDRITNIIPLPTEPNSTSPLPPTPPPTNPSAPPNQTVILLVETANHEATGKVIKSMVAHLPTYPYSISIWNWEILKVTYNDGNPLAPLTKDMFIGSMTYDALENEVIAAWGDGKTERLRLLPDLHKHPVMLSPCVSSNMQILEEYLPGRLNTIIPHPSPGITVRPPSPHASTDQKKIIFLIDSKGTGATRNVMEPVLGFLPGSGYDRVEMWHWKVLELGRDGEEVRQRNIDKCFYASIRVAKDSEGAGREISTVWQDGKGIRARVSEGGKVEIIQKPE